jgi:hypothetical protein
MILSFGGAQAEDVPYTVFYYLNGTNTGIAGEKVAYGRIGSKITESPINIPGYTPDAQSKSLTLSATGNEIIFYYSLPPSAIITNFTVAPKANRFRITAGTTSTNTIVENNVATNGATVYNVASTAEVTTFSFVTMTTDAANPNLTTAAGNPSDKVIHTPVATVLDKDGNEIIPTITQGSGIYARTNASSGDNRTLNRPTGEVSFEIPANYIGEITVLTSAAQDPAKTFTFKLNVDTLAKTIAATPASGEITTGNFFVDDVAWHVLSKSVGTTYSNGTDVLILPGAANAFGTSRFNTTDTGTYLNSYMRTTKLPEVFDSLYWAHDYAIKAAEQTSGLPTSSDVGNSLTGTSANDGGAVISTGTFANDTEGHLDGCFLLSWNETYRAGAIYGWSANNGSADIRKAANNVDGTISRYFLRSVHNTSSNVDVVTYNGSGLYTGNASNYGKTTVQGFRPAMILRLPTE